MTTIDAEYDAVVDQIRRWPVARRFALLHDLLHALAAEGIIEDRRPPGPRRPTLAQAIGFAAGEGPPPTDEEVERWLEERRMERFG